MPMSVFTEEVMNSRENKVRAAVLVTGQLAESGPVTRARPTGAGPGKNNWTDHVASGLPDKKVRYFWAFLVLKNRKRPNGNHVFHEGCSRRLSHTHSY